MAIPTIVPVTCTVCFGSALLPEQELLRLPHTVLFSCAYCQSVVSVVDKVRERGSPTDGAQAA